MLRNFVCKLCRSYRHRHFTKYNSWSALAKLHFLWVFPATYIAWHVDVSVVSRIKAADLASYPGPSQLFNVARWKAGGPGRWSHVRDVALDRPSTGCRQATKGHPDRFHKVYAKITNLFKRLPLDNWDALKGTARHLFSKVRSVLFKSWARPCTNIMWFWLPGPPTFQCATLKSWDGPGYDAKRT